jgi:endonuclease/exonuclease/phosphatase family metal-dependent hydrolase
MFWDRIDRGRFVDCHYSRNGYERQTYFRPGAKPHHLKIQDDHLLVTSLLGHRVVHCEVVDTPEARELSDHVPVIAELAL